MNFFKSLSEMVSDGTDLNITVRKTGDELTVSLLPKAQKLEDKAQNKIRPLVLSGTPEELDNGFVAAITDSVSKSVGLLSNMADYEASVKQAEKESKMKKEKEDREKKEAEANKKKFDKLMEKAESQIEAEDWTNAMKSLESAKELDIDNKKVESKIADVKEKSSKNELF